MSLRRFLRTVAWAAGLGVVAVAALAWHVSNRIGNEALSVEYDHRGPWCDDAVVVAVGDSTVTLKPVGDDSSRVRRGPGWGLRWRQGWGEAGPLLAASGEGVTRRFAPGKGELMPGTRVDLSAVRERSDPLHACNLEFRTVKIQGPLGAEPSWYIPGSADTWVVMVHGKGADLTEALPTLGIYAAHGLPCLVISYRNDGGGPSSPDGRFHYGLTEWEDLQAACEYAVAHGAKRLVVVGFSMGGGIVLRFLERSSLASRVVGAVLDAPVVDFGKTIDLGIRLARIPVVEAPLPEWTGPLAKSLASLRFGLDWREYSLLRSTDRLRAPLLVFHGDADDVVPFEGSVALAHARPDLVTFERYAGARHLECWNLDWGRYESAVDSFLRRVAAGH